MAATASANVLRQEEGWQLEKDKESLWLEWSKEGEKGGQREKRAQLMWSLRDPGNDFGFHSKCGGFILS